MLAKSEAEPSLRHGALATAEPFNFGSGLDAVTIIDLEMKVGLKMVAINDPVGQVDNEISFLGFPKWSRWTIFGTAQII